MRSTPLPFLVLVAALAVGPVHAGEAALYFSPDGGTQAAIVNAINQAETETLVAAYTLTSKPITDALLHAARRGVHVHVLLDRRAPNGNGSTTPALQAAGIIPRTYAKGGLMHWKVILIDQTTIILGSYNFTRNAEHKNAEIAIIYQNPKHAAEIAARFALMFRHGKPTIAHMMPPPTSHFTLRRPTMVKVTAPALSLDASGTIGNTLTFASWKGRNYARQRVIPTNPRSASQTGNRAMFAFLASQWAGMSTNDKATYETEAANRSISEFNAFVSQNMDRWQLNKAPAMAYPAAESSTPLTVSDMTLTGGAGHVQIDMTPSAATDIWGFMLCRDTAEITAPSWTNCIALVEADGANEVTYVDSPLDAGTYHYRCAVFNDDGVLGTFIADDTAAAT